MKRQLPHILIIITGWFLLSAGVAAQQPGSSSSGGSGGSSTNNSASTIAFKTVTICGQVNLASLDKILALTKAVSLNGSKVCSALKLGKPRNNQELCSPTAEMSEQTELKLDAANTMAKLLAEGSDLYSSRLRNDCEIDGSREVGDQRKAVIAMLNAAKLLLPDLKRAGVAGANDPEISAEWLQNQIVTLTGHIGNVDIHLRNSEGVLVKTGSADGDGNYKFNLDIPQNDCQPVAQDRSYSLTSGGDNHYTRARFVPDCKETLRVNLQIEDRPVSLLTRAVVGYQQSGAASAGREQNFFFDFFVSKSLPFVQKVNPRFGEKAKIWSSIRVSSVPQSGDVTIGNLASGFASTLADVRAKDAARVFDFLAGGEIFLTGNKALLPSFDRRTRMQFALAFIAGGGIVTPEEPQEKAVSFKVGQGATGLPAEVNGKEFVTFVPKDRDRFFRQYYAGLRVQSFFFNRHNIPIQRFPAQFDVTVGQNEYVSGGRLRGAVIRIDGYFPLPYEDLRFINLFGTAIIRPSEVKTSTPLLLERADGVKLGSNVAVIPYEQFNRDYYKVGVGIDFIDFVGKLKDALRPASQ